MKKKKVEPKEIVEDLVNYVIRAFYDEASVVVVQYLVSLREPVPDYDIANKLNLTFKFSRETLTKLHNDFLIQMFPQKIDGKTVSTYCIHYDTFINVVKLRLSLLKKWVEKQAEQKVVLYYCLECNKGFDQFEIMEIMKGGKISARNLPICDCWDCSGEIVEDMKEYKERTGSEIPLTQVLEKDLGHIFKLLNLTDTLVVPKNSRSEISKITTRENANKINMITRKRENYDRATGGLSSQKWKSSVAILDSGERFEVESDEDSNEFGSNKIKDNTPFFLGGNINVGMGDEKELLKQQDLINQNRQFNENFLELIRSGKNVGTDKNGNVSDKEFSEEERDEDEDDNEEISEMRVLVDGKLKKIKNIRFEDELRMSEEEYTNYMNITHRNTKIEW